MQDPWERGAIKAGEQSFPYLLEPEAKLWLHVIARAVRDAASRSRFKDDAVRFLTTPRRIGPVLELIGIDQESWFGNLKKPMYHRDWCQLATKFKRHFAND